MTVIAKPNTFSPNTSISSSEVNDNFDTIYNDYNGNIAAANLASNSVTTAKIADSNVTTAKIADSNVTTAKVADSAITPAKRTGGFKIGTISGATLGTTGNKAITGVGFTPKLVKFYALPTTNGGINNTGYGAMTPNGQYLIGGYSTQTPAAARMSAINACIGWMLTSSSWGVKGSYVSMDPDGFTINIDTASSSFDVAYEAYA